jgi:type I restriction enzyme S subunit
MTDMATEAKILGVPTIVETQGKNLLLNQRVGKLIIKKPELIYFPYLKYVLNREQVKKYFLKFAGGGLQINLGKDDILSVEIPLPPLEEQKRIAEILDLAEELRTKRREAITPNAEKIIVLYLFYYLLNPNVREKFLFPFVTKSTISGINQGNLAKVLVMIPPLHLQQEFSQRVEAVEKLKASHRASLSELDALFASLQHRAFRGEL